MGNLSLKTGSIVRLYNGQTDTTFTLVPASLEDVLAHKVSNASEIGKKLSKSNLYDLIELDVDGKPHAYIVTAIN